VALPLRVFHPCEFNFDDVDLRRLGNVVDGGTSLSGFNDTIETDGGGFWRADFTNGEAMDRDTGLRWRALTDAMDGGSTPVIVLFCSERHFQPLHDRVGASPNTPIDDTAPDKGAAFTASEAAALRATTLKMSGNSEREIIGGELFSIEHATWGWRAYRIGPDGMAEDGTISFRPPLREAIEADTPLEFDNPRCQMRAAAATSNPTNIGRFTACSIAFAEDMRKPPA
jgi:hypothetical protein